MKQLQVVVRLPRRQLQVVVSPPLSLSLGTQPHHARSIVHTFSSLRSLSVSFVELFLVIMLRSAGEAVTFSSPSPSLSGPSSSEMSCLLLVGVGVERVKLFDRTNPRRTVPSPNPLLGVTAAGGPMSSAGLEDSLLFFFPFPLFDLLGHFMLSPALAAQRSQSNVCSFLFGGTDNRELVQPDLAGSLSVSRPPPKQLCSRT